MSHDSCSMRLAALGIAQVKLRFGAVDDLLPCRQPLSSDDVHPRGDMEILSCAVGMRYFLREHSLLCFRVLRAAYSSK